MMANGGGAYLVPWLIDKIGLVGAGVNVFTRKVGVIMSMFQRIDAANAPKE